MLQASPAQARVQMPNSTTAEKATTPRRPRPIWRRRSGFRQNALSPGEAGRRRASHAEEAIRGEGGVARVTRVTAFWAHMATLVETLSSRGMLHEATPDLAARLAQGPVTGYVGFDPTADSLDVGSLMPVMGLAWLQRLGGRPLVVIGGGTGMIGDPSGKRAERPMLSDETVQANAAAIQAQLSRFLDFGSGADRRADAQQCRLAGADRAAGVPARHRQAFHRELHAAEGIGEVADGDGNLVHRVQLHAGAGVRLRAPGEGASTASFSSAAAISGGTSPPASSSRRGATDASCTAWSCRCSPRPQGRSSERPRPATSGSTRRGHRRTRSISSGCRSKTPTSNGC